MLGILEPFEIVLFTRDHLSKSNKYTNFEEHPICLILPYLPVFLILFSSPVAVIKHADKSSLREEELTLTHGSWA